MAIFQSTEFNFTHLNANGTTVLSAPQAGVGSAYAFLHSITINTKGAAANICTVYNNSAGSGDVIAVLDTVNGQIQTMFYDVKCPAGLTIVLATGTAADITVAWRKGSQE